MPAPLIIAKLNNKGTEQFRDDRLLRGAHFVIRPDDGDGKYEPEGDDSPVVFEGIATPGFLVYKNPAIGDYWVVEDDAPSGFERARRPTLVHVTTTTPLENCIQLGKQERCFADEDTSGGFIIVVIPNSPAELPPTDTSVDRALQEKPRRRRRVA